MRVLFFALAIWATTAIHGQERPDLASAAVRQAGPKVKSISITRNGKPVTQLLRDGNDWKLANGSGWLDTTDWAGWPSADPLIVETARNEGVAGDDRLYVYRTPMKQRSQKVYFDAHGRVHRIVWVNIQDPSTVALADPQILEAQFAEFYWTGNVLARFTNDEQKVEWNFKYDRTFRLLQIFGTEEGKKVTYRFTYK
jgi:hypothetical protein